MTQLVELSNGDWIRADMVIGARVPAADPGGLGFRVVLEIQGSPSWWSDPFPSGADARNWASKFCNDINACLAKAP